MNSISLSSQWEISDIEDSEFMLQQAFQLFDEDAKLNLGTEEIANEPISHRHRTDVDIVTLVTNRHLPQTNSEVKERKSITERIKVDGDTPLLAAQLKKQICVICYKKYGRKGDLKLHVQKKHADYKDVDTLLKNISRPRSSKVGKSYKCPVTTCPSGYVRKSDLTKHMKKKHP